MPGTAVDSTTMDTSIFKAFPQAVISGIWSIGTCQHGTLVGNEYTKLADIDAIVDEGANASINSTPETLASDLLIYVNPCQMPTAIANVLATGYFPTKVGTAETVSAYMLYNKNENAYYEIVDAGIGKNQHTGQVEHIELKVVRTDVING